MIKDLMVFKWFDRWLRGEDNGIEKQAPILLYVMNKNEWRPEQEWPLARTQWTEYYFHSHGQANRRTGDGAISMAAPQDEPADQFAYDPMNPAPTHGGNNLLESVGALDQKQIEERQDVLVYTTPALNEDVEATGPITVTLFAASSAKDTDFTAKLCDVYPDGRSLNLADGIIRARYRESLTEPSLIEPGKIYEYTIDLWATSNLFRKGHRIRVQISSSNFPRFDRNTNAGGEGGKNNVIKAEQTIYHDAAHPSHLILPVIPAR
jgi:putative CocE/NonD family hydrolase